MDRMQAAEIFEHLFDAARELDEARAVASAFAAQDESAASLEDFIVKLNSELIEALFGRFPGLMSFEEFPAISSTLTWDQVTLPESVSEADIDQMIFSMLRSHWQKTAMIIGRSLELCRERSLPITAEVFGARIQALADSDSIEVRGDPRKWGHSEVRLER
jgi:hypothetical protein